MRLAATFTLGGGRLRPASRSVPPFLAVRLSFAAADARGHVVIVEADRRYRLRVPPRGRAVLHLAGQRPGRYSIVADGHARATLVVGGEAGP